ncbi:hypothetical protein P4H71_08935 [Paenibacillus kribbensis]|uniref:hypothetical protein n=1 Tax=Paenibacillus TaxID=44249 RepID=UPI002DB655AF|nr:MULTISPECIES: hypothetical protein [Paenibacillus]MEC0234449.1 hypothetical protein [Paenibacillus kribbensis]
MSKDKSYTDPRWNDLGRPKVIGHREIPKTEQKENQAQFQEHLRKIGVLKDKNKD